MSYLWSYHQAEWYIVEQTLQEQCFPHCQQTVPEYKLVYFARHFFNLFIIFFFAVFLALSLESRSPVVPSDLKF